MLYKDATYVDTKILYIAYYYLIYSIAYVIIKLSGGDILVPIKGRCCVYALEYHIVWCVKYRRKVITNSVEETLLSVLKRYAYDNGFSIVEANTCPDHVHLLIQAPPTVYIPDIMKGMKGVSARVLFKAYPELKGRLCGGHMWNPSYFVATVSENTEQQIINYIQSQKER